jgi:hypothetical protein
MSSISQIYLGDDEELVKRKRKDKRIIPNFYMIGNGNMNKHKIQSIDLLDEAMSLSKAGQYVLRMIKDGISFDNTDGEVYISMSDLTATNVTVFKKGYKELMSRNLAKRTKRSHYMINPNALIPLDYDLALELWEKS